MAGTYIFRDMMQVEFHTDCGSVPREKRILSRNINVYLQREAEGAGRVKVDEKVKEYCKQNPTVVHKGSVSSKGSALKTLQHTEPPSPPNNSSKNLPNEIIYQILSYFTSLDSQRSEADALYRENCSLCYLSTLYTCCLISRSWNGAATATLYSKLKLDLDGTCEYHWRGIPWGDGVFWWNRRTSYLRDRYLKLLLQTLTAKPELGQFFRIIEIDLHHHLPSDYRVLPLYTKLISLCPNLTAIIGDPCIFFLPVDLYLESLRLDLLNFFTRGQLHKGRQAITLRHQKKLWKALSEHTAWESWEWAAHCQKIQLPAFHRFHYNWKSLKHLSIKELYCGPGSPSYEITANPIACLDALESLSLSSTGLKILQNVPANKLTSLSIEVLSNGNQNITFQRELAELWAYLSQDSGVTSRLQKLSICGKPYYAYLTERWLPKTLSLTPNLQELSISYPYTAEGNTITLTNDQSLALTAQWQAAFPRCSKLQKLSFLCPGWSHNKLLLKVLRIDGVFPALREVEYYRSTAIIEMSQSQTANEATVASKAKGEIVDNCLEIELIEKRNFGRVLGASVDWRRIRMMKTNYK